MRSLPWRLKSLRGSFLLAAFLLVFICPLTNAANPLPEMDARPVMSPITMPAGMKAVTRQSNATRPDTPWFIRSSRRARPKWWPMASSIRAFPMKPVFPVTTGVNELVCPFRASWWLYILLEEKSLLIKLDDE